MMPSGSKSNLGDFPKPGQMLVISGGKESPTSEKKRKLGRSIRDTLRVGPNKEAAINMEYSK